MYTFQAFVMKSIVKMNRLLILVLTSIVSIYGHDYQDTGPFEGFVIGGVSVPIMMYPHVAQLKLQTQICGGSIISDRVILTAAHCLYTADGWVVSPVNVTAYLGSDTLMKGYKHSACQVIPHEKYNGSAERTSYYYDLGLIFLKEYIEFGPSVKRIEIANTEEFRDERYTFTLAGFGAVTNLFPGGPNKKLTATRMFYINSKKCEETRSLGNMNVPDHMFCMIGEGWTSDCYGDSGSGIIWKRMLVGVVSTGRDVFCGSDLLPSMYTDIVHFREWINEKVADLESVPADKCKKSKRLKDKQKLASRKRKKIANKNRLTFQRSSHWEMVLEIQ